VSENDTIAINNQKQTNKYINCSENVMSNEVKLLFSNWSC